VLVIRSLLAFVVTQAAMGLVTAPWQLFALRALLGVFAGYGSLTVSMAAESVPREKMAAAIGTVQVAQRLGSHRPDRRRTAGANRRPAASSSSPPPSISCRSCSSRPYREPRTRQARAASRGLREVFRELSNTPGFWMVFVTILGLQLVDRSFGPILPLYVERLVPVAQVPFVSGVLFSVAACFAALGHRVAAPLLERHAPRMLIAASSLATAAGLLLLILAPSIAAFGVALAIAGVAIGIGMTTTFTSGGTAAADAHATGFGLMMTASSSARRESDRPASSAV
jgi:DHA1 family multidrug resistance protein-like MFS transporter